MSYQSITVRPVAGSLGAEISGIDLAPLSNSATAAIRQAFTDHLVLFFHDQKLTPEQHLAFSRLFGPPSRMPYIKPMEGYPDIIAVLKEADENKISTFGNVWHSDFSFLDEPPLGSALYAREVPSHGGDTLFTNMYAAYEALSPGLKRMLDPLRAMHSGKPYGVGGMPKRSAHQPLHRDRAQQSRGRSRGGPSRGAPASRRAGARRCSSIRSTPRASRI